MGSGRRGRGSGTNLTLGIMTKTVRCPSSLSSHRREIQRERAFRHAPRDISFAKFSGPPPRSSRHIGKTHES